MSVQLGACQAEIGCGCLGKVSDCTCKGFVPERTGPYDPDDGLYCRRCGHGVDDHEPSERPE